MMLEFYKINKIIQCIISTNGVGFEAKNFLRINNIIPLEYRPIFNTAFYTGNAAYISYCISLTENGDVVVSSDGKGERILNLTNKSITYFSN